MNYIIKIISLLCVSSISLSISLSQQTPPKLCIDCKYFISNKPNDIFSKCSFLPTDEGKINFLVTGVNQDGYYYCSTARDSNNMCGEDAKHYEKKDS